LTFLGAHRPTIWAELSGVIENTVPPSRSPILTEAELRLMDVLWERGPCSVQQVLLALPNKPRLAYNSVLTTMRILEKKGYVEHVKDGRAHIYAPAIRREEATRSEISHLVSRFFKNSRELLLLNILEDASIDHKELQRLRKLIAKSPAPEAD
jgi:predicted transcriptional regulator